MVTAGPLGPTVWLAVLPRLLLRPSGTDAEGSLTAKQMRSPPRTDVYLNLTWLHTVYQPFLTCLSLYLSLKGQFTQIRICFLTQPITRSASADNFRCLSLFYFVFFKSWITHRKSNTIPWETLRRNHGDGQWRSVVYLFLKVLVVMAYIVICTCYSQLGLMAAVQEVM